MSSYKLKEIDFEDEELGEIFKHRVNIFNSKEVIKKNEMMKSMFSSLYPYYSKGINTNIQNILEELNKNKCKFVIYGTGVKATLAYNSLKKYKLHNKVVFFANTFIDSGVMKDCNNTSIKNIYELIYKNKSKNKTNFLSYMVV